MNAHWRFVGVVALVGLGLLIAARAGWARTEPPKVGQAAPAFQLTASDGKSYKLEDFHGKSWVVLAWYPKAFTSGCTTECKSLRDALGALHAYRVQVFGASVDTPERNAEFAKTHQLGFPLLSDPTKKTAEAYGVLMPVVGIANRWTFVIDPQGVVRAVNTSVKPDTAGADLARLLDSLGVPKR